jgi:hypothetical protein
MSAFKTQETIKRKFFGALPSQWVGTVKKVLRNLTGSVLVRG